MVRHHVGRQPYPALPRTMPQIVYSLLAPKIARDAVVEQRICRGHSLRVAGKLLDSLGRMAALPQPDEPQPREAEASKAVQLLVRYFVQAADVAAILARKLV